ncbi:MAG: universal stress protein [Bacteroidia bacterium]|jgi:nucleotide-binding universal stress UspA family protein|nr:universal stress protein [Bacteroidia bacterium]MCC6768909.1 universal stress protein [Bacteroidia bacterium]
MRTIEIRKILVPTDFSETANIALDHAVNLAQMIKAEITLLHVLSSFSFRVNLPEVSELEESHQTRISGVVDSKLTLLADSILDNSGVRVNIMVSSGRIRDEVVRVADEIDADLIILGTHGVSGIKEFFMGSNAFRVVMEASCPVLSVRTSAQKMGFHDIVIPIDNSFHSREKLGVSVQLAKLYGSTLHVCGLRSHDHQDEDLNAKFRMKMKQVEDFLVEKEVNYTLQTVFCTNIAKAATDFATEKKADLIVIMNEQEMNDTGFFMGAYAQQIVNHSNIPVLSIRPTSGSIGNVVPY